MGSYADEGDGLRELLVPGLAEDPAEPLDPFSRVAWWVDPDLYVGGGYVESLFAYACGDEDPGSLAEVEEG